METNKHEPFHYFASCAFGWATAETRQTAVEKLVNEFRNEFKTGTKNLQKKGEIGAYCWSCKVMAPSTENYKIDFYQPKGVEIRNGRHHHTTYITNKEIAYYTTEETK